LRAIAELPPDLDEMYNRILGQIAKDDVPYAIRILRWLTFASRPLYLKEVAEVAALDPDYRPAFDRDEVLQDPAEVLAICSSLVTVVQEPSMEYFDEENDCYIGQYSHNSVDLVGKSERVVVLAHYSVKEYLVSQRILESEAKLYGIDPDIGHKTLAKSCLLYMFQLDVLDLPKHVVRRDFVLTIYSAEEWIRHYRLIQTPDPELNELVVELFKAENTFSTMIMFSPKRRAQFWPYREKLTKSVFVACELGLPDIVQRLVSETDFDVNEAHNETTTLLEIAARSGFSSLVEFLLEKGAIANEGALNSACSNGHLELVRLLLEQGAQVNTHGAKGFSALRCASLSGHLGTVQYLIERGADVKAPDELALCQASQYGHLDIVRVLVENGADINASIIADYNTLGGLYGNALCGASYRGHFEVVEYLVENGANVNVSDGRDRKPLHGASCNDHLEIVKYLVKKGADVDGSESHQNALVVASEEGNFEVVQCLVENGANVNASASDGWHGNALYGASYKNHLEIVEYLVKNGADVDATSSGKYKNALIAASARGNFEVVRCLVENGADVNAQGDDGQRSALGEAASRCLWDHWDYCFENGADVNAQGDDGQRSALGEAASRCLWDHWDYRFENGVGVNFQSGGTSMDQDDIVKYLIEHGAVNKTSVGE
jgi:ankyrin repeat protein